MNSMLLFIYILFKPFSLINGWMYNHLAFKENKHVSLLMTVTVDVDVLPTFCLIMKIVPHTCGHYQIVRS